MSAIEKVGGGAATFLDKRVSSNKFLKKNLAKVFPDHWSFMLGEIALYSFIILLLTGVFLSLFFVPSATEVVYNGSYVPLDARHQLRRPRRSAHAADSPLVGADLRRVRLGPPAARVLHGCVPSSP